MNERFAAITHEDVVQAAQTMKPARIRKWSCLVPVDAGTLERPVKSLWLTAANLVVSDKPRATPADFISHSAVAGLRRLQFEVKYYE